MRGHDAIQDSWFSYVSLEERIPKQLHCVAYDSWLTAYWPQ